MNITTLRLSIHHHISHVLSTLIFDRFSSTKEVMEEELAGNEDIKMGVGDAHRSLANEPADS